MTPLVTFRTSPEERAAWREGPHPHPVKITLDRVGSDEFERYAELLRECLVKAGYGGE